VKKKIARVGGVSFCSVHSTCCEQFLSLISKKNSAREHFAMKQVDDRRGTPKVSTRNFSCLVA
jgi:hypothetical protein